MEVEPTEWGAGRQQTGGQMWKTAAKACSFLLHPLLMPSIGALILLYGPTYISILPASYKFYILGIFALTTLFFPLFTLVLMKSLRIISGFSWESRQERILPLLVVSAGYVVCYILLARYMSLGFFPQLLSWALVIAVACFGVNLFWKISLHMAAIGGIVGMLLYMSLRGYGAMVSILLAFILLSGLLGASRLYLGRHNVWQVLAGFACGVGVMVGILSFF